MTTTTTVGTDRLTREQAKVTKMYARVGVTLENFSEDDPHVVFEWTGSATDKAHDLIRWFQHAPVTYNAAVRELERRGKLQKVLREVERIAGA